MAKLPNLAASLAFLALAAPLAAQSTVAPGPAGGLDSRIKMGIVVPMGKAGTRAEQTPRFEAWGERARARDASFPPLRLDSGKVAVKPMSFGVTLDSQPMMILNGREVPGLGGRRHVSALGWVGISVGVVAIAVGAAAFGAFGDCITPC